MVIDLTQRLKRNGASRVSTESAFSALRLFVSTGVGFLVGLLALLVLRWSLPGLERVVYFLSYPGIRLGRLWTDAGFPPHGEGAYGVIALGILIQWAALGFILGLCWRNRPR